MQNVTPNKSSLSSVYRKASKEEDLDFESSELIEANIAHGITCIQEIMNSEENSIYPNHSMAGLSIVDDSLS